MDIRRMVPADGLQKIERAQSGFHRETYLWKGVGPDERPIKDATGREVLFTRDEAKRIIKGEDPVAIIKERNGADVLALADEEAEYKRVVRESNFVRVSRNFEAMADARPGVADYKASVEKAAKRTPRKGKAGN